MTGKIAAISRQNAEPKKRLLLVLQISLKKRGIKTKALKEPLKFTFFFSESDCGPLLAMRYWGNWVTN
jgi:hypothetical protein